MPAWAVNQLYRTHRIVFDRLLAAGERFRNAQTAQLAGKSADIRGPLEARRAALSELTGHAAKILTEAGSAAAPDTMRRVTTTLEALSTYAGIPDTPQAGTPHRRRAAARIRGAGGAGAASRVGPAAPSAPTRIIPFEHKKTSRKAGAKRAGDRGRREGARG